MSSRDCPAQNRGERATPDCAFKQLIHPKNKELGGFSVRRAFPTVGLKAVGPWVFFDHMGPAEFPAGQGIDVRPHPHINLATVSYLFEGEILHRDSLGSNQVIRPGDVNLMVAGKGIVHSERQRPEIRATKHRLHGLQLWLALPEDQEEIDPSFHHYPTTDIPAVNVDGVAVRVIMGTAYGVTSPVKTLAETLYIEAHLKAGQTLKLPFAEERAIYLVDGNARVGATGIDEYTLGVLSDRDDVVIQAMSETRMALIGGERLSERFIDWNFVSSRKERIEQARQDWQTGRFPKVPGDEHEYIPYPGAHAQNASFHGV